MKIYKIQNGIGKTKHLVSYHDGIKKHTDGSDFYDIAIFKNQARRNDFIEELQLKGYSELIN